MNNLDFLKNNGIDTDSAIELLGDIETYNETLDDFLIESETRMPDIEKYKDNGDMDNYSILVHAMKGDSKYLGFTKLAELSFNHQMESQNGNIDYVNDNYEELIGEANRIVSIVKEYLGK